MAALQHGQSVDSVRLLLGLGASVTEVDREGNTALHWALLGTQDTTGGDIFRDYKWLLSVSVLIGKVCHMIWENIHPALQTLGPGGRRAWWRRW